ncbi:zinc-dependent alcohol dehydrogenase family protein [Kutzneria sp. NPDC051319]|uniref:zinc-dependent alcohol dehydrogenase family protein n=1 Tax=Kutzneria sp. NPDC051319 TaxID=3155047 RepID=UPI003429787F
MKAVSFDRYGEPRDVLGVTDLPVPEPGPGQVRLRIRLSPVNPSDLLYVRGHYSGVEEHFPSGAGFESVSIVDKLGPGVEGLTVGQRVFAHNPDGGNWAQYAVVPTLLVWPVPDDIPDEQAAGFMINPATAILMVRHVLAVPAGSWLLQTAAGSELGRMIIRLARHDGIRTLNVVRRPEAVGELKNLGADEVIVSTDGPIDEQVRKIVGEAGVDHALDPVAGPTGTEVFRSLSENGRMLLYGSLTGQGISVGADPRLTLSGRRTLEVFWLGYWLPRLSQLGLTMAGLIEEMSTLIRAGVLENSPGERFGLEEVVAAVVEAEAVGRKGKVLIVP